MGDAIEYRFDDNKLVYNEVVNPNGPNLRIDKHTNWYWNSGEIGGVLTQTLTYELRIMNLGNQFIEDPIVTDTLPISTTFDGCWFNHGPWMGDCIPNEANHRLCSIVLTWARPPTEKSNGACLRRFEAPTYGSGVRNVGFSR